MLTDSRDCDSAKPLYGPDVLLPADDQDEGDDVGVPGMMTL